MKYYLAGFLAWLAVTAVLYLAGAFVAVSFHPVAWDPPGRVFVAFLAVTAGAILAALAHSAAEDNAS